MEAKKKNIPSLTLLTEFEKVLRTYEPSSRTLEILKETPLVILVGPTAAGRNTLINLLLETNRYHYIVSDTTRPPRENNGKMEKNGHEYWFKSEQEFLEGLKSGKYLEAAIIHNQQVSGISVDELEAALNTGKIAFDEIEVVGAEKIQSYKPQTLSVFLLPPSFEVWMQRLKGRGDMSEEEFMRRLQSSLNEISAALAADFYQFVINHEIHEAAVLVDELARGRRLDEVEQAAGRSHAEQLAIDVQLYLER